MCIASDRGLVIVVADGAGSAARSEIGAELAVTVAAEHLRGDLAATDVDWTRCVVAAARSARTAVLSRALDDGAASRDYACTLLVAVATPRGGAALQLGDGLIAYRDHDGWAPLFWPQKGEYANMTRFLTEDDADEVWETAPLPAHGIDLALMSDGLEGLALHFATRSIHEPFLEAVFAPLRAAKGSGEALAISVALEGLLASARITDRADDDLTLCIATPA